MDINKQTTDFNSQAFTCEMRTFPAVEFSHIVEKALTLDTLSPSDKAKVGLAYYTGFEIKKDRAKAIEIWQNDAGADSLFYLSVDAFLNNKDRQGFKYLHDSAKLGNKQAFLRLGYCYIMAIGVEGDAERAYRVFDKLAREKVPEAVYFVGAMQMLPSQPFVEFNPESAQQKLMWSVQHGCKFAQFEQGIVLLRNAKNEAEKQQAVKLIKSAGEKQEVRAMMWLAVESIKGEYFPVDRERAEKYMSQCIKLGFEPAVTAFKKALQTV